jgi:hypothetical protein
MPIDFPSSPTNGQSFAGYVYDSSLPGWRNINSDFGVQSLNTMGLRNVVPTSVQVASGSATVNANGLVTYNGITSISVNGVFTSTYTNYKIILHQMRSNTANTAVKFRLRSAGTDYTGNQYYTNGTIQSGATAPSNYSALNISWIDLGAQPSSGSDNYGIFTGDLSSPASNTTMKTLSGSGYGYGTSVQAIAASGLVGITSSHDGFTIFTNTTATFNGAISVYGYTN